MSLSALANGVNGALINYGDMVNQVINSQTGADVTTGALHPDIFYNAVLEETIRDAAETYQYFKVAEQINMPDKVEGLQFRRLSPLQAHTVPLEEGQPPVSDKMSMEVYTIKSGYSYGRYCEVTDKVEWRCVDPILTKMSAEYSIVAVETLDLLAQDMLMTCAQKYFAGNAYASLAAIGSASKTLANVGMKPELADFRLIALAFKRAKVQPYDSKFWAFVSPEFLYDMIDDVYVQNLMRITGNVGTYYEDQQIPDMFGFHFVEVNNCPNSSIWFDSTNSVYKCLRYNTSTGAIDAITSSGTVSGYVKDSRTGKDASYIPNQRVFTAGTGYALLKVNHIIIIGKDALVRTALTGEDQAKMYTQQFGSAGVLDPLFQRASIGFKINNVAFASKRPEAIVDYICIPTQLNV